MDEKQLQRINENMFEWNWKKERETKQTKNNGFSEEQIEQLKQIFAQSNFKTSNFSKTQSIIAIVVGTITIITAFVGVLYSIWDTTEKIGRLEEQVSKLVEQSSEMSKYLYEDDGVKDQLGMINEALNLKVINVTEDDTVALIEKVSIEKNDISNTTSALYAEMTVGTDLNGNVYIAEDLIGETVLLVYRDEGKDVFFLGQYNENYHWDGYCVTNAYNDDGTLYGICESNFNDGKRLDYKTILCVEKGNNEWGYYQRVCKEETNIGVSIHYRLTYDKVKNFTGTNVRITDILYVDKFIDEQEKNIKKYYFGNTSDGMYNDDTGNAYLVIYDEADGKVKTLYVGRFVDGYPSDKTGNAWNIAFSESLGYYVHNTGTFSGGHADKHSSKEITHEEIEKIISKYNFQCELNWK